MRAESVPMEFSGDWRGVFIRGDQAFGYKMGLESMLQVLMEKAADDPRFFIAKREIKELIELLDETKQDNNKTPVQVMKPYEQCLLKRERWWDDTLGGDSSGDGHKP